MRFPVWRELKPTNQQTDGLTRFSFHEVSRLKGIETSNPFSATKNHLWLSMRFPVWRELKLALRAFSNTLTGHFPWGFPFEGNWNISFSFPTSGLTGFAFHEVSRLKGIETSASRLFLQNWYFSFHEVSRLKGIETWMNRIGGYISLTFHEVSRLKGIETLLAHTSKFTALTFHEVSRLKGIETYRQCLWRSRHR